MNKFCPNCGKENQEGALYCAGCGAAMNAQVNIAPQVNNQNNKSKIAAGILGIFLGYFGVHNFYLGYTGKAVGQLLISVLSCFMLSPISAIWGLIEGIMILTGSIDKDANGIPLKD